MTAPDTGKESDTPPFHLENVATATNSKTILYPRHSRDNPM
jgi:hypothetical protein